MQHKETLKNFIENDLLMGMDNVQIGYDDDLLLSGLVNSLGVMRLVAFVKDELGVTIPPEDVTIEHFTTINALTEYLQATASN